MARILIQHCDQRIGGVWCIYFAANNLSVAYLSPIEFAVFGMIRRDGGAVQ